MIGWLNVGGLLLGLLALILAIVNVMRVKNDAHNGTIILSIMSLSACVISLFFQLFNTYL